MKKYLERYAEAEAEPIATLAASKGRHWETAVVVPCFGEDEITGALFSSLDKAAGHRGHRVLGILVVNAPQTAPREKREANSRLLSRLGAADDFQWREERHIDWIVVDRSSGSRAFGEKDGVGRARKLGADAALAIYSRGLLQSPYFHTTDADARVAPDYFESRDGSEAARWHPYRHALADESLALPLALYEIHLRYYVLGLAHAGSSYAFPTIGSTMSVRYDSYAAVRGFPRRDAGEDFYLFDKLAKVGAVGMARGEVTLAARASDRVPFGTGAGIAKIAATLARGERYRLYDPRVFEDLREWLRALDALSEHRDPARLPEVPARLGAERAVSVALATRKEPKSLRRHLHGWFDGLRTLQFIRDMEKERYPGLPWEEALGSAPFLAAAASSASAADAFTIDAFSSLTSLRRHSAHAPIVATL